MSRAFTRRAVDSGLLPSMSSAGDCSDNAVIESFWDHGAPTVRSRRGWRPQGVICVDRQQGTDTG